jgi:hypothetical protein
VQADLGVVPALVLVFLVLLATAAVFWGYQYFTSRPIVTDASPEQTEGLFQNFVANAYKGETGDILEEWRAARSDHKVIAYSIARCLHIDLKDMTPAQFSMLMLDLWPNGDHWWGNMRNESALVALRQLHAGIVLDFVSRPDQWGCKDATGDKEATGDPDSFRRWRNTLVSLENGTILAPVIVAMPTNTLLTEDTGQHAAPPSSTPPLEKEKTAAEPK